MLSSHHFLNDTSNNEKDFVILNLSKGYVAIIEVKDSSKKFQKGKKQLFDGKDRIREIFTPIISCESESYLSIFQKCIYYLLWNLRSEWLFVGIFYAQNGEEPFLCPEDKCSKYAIVGEDQIKHKLNAIEEEIIDVSENY